MRNLVELVKEAFRDGGLLYRDGRSYREEQERYAIFVAECLSRRDEQVSLAHVAPGTGKTLACLVPLAIQACLTGQKGLVATYTRELRQDILGNLGAINALLKLYPEGTLEKTQITIGERISFSSIASLQRARDLRDTYPDYYNWVNSSYEAGEYPLLSGYDFLPCENDLGVTYEERSGVSSKSPEFAAFEKLREANRKASDECDILAITHAMLAINGIEFGTKLNTNRHSEKSVARSVIIDEADLLIDQGANAVDLRLSMPYLKMVSNNLGIEEAFDAFHTELSKVVPASERSTYVRICEHAEQNRYVDILDRFHDEIASAALADGVDDETYDEGIAIMVALERMIAVIAHMDGRNSAFTNLIERGEVFNRIERNHDQEVSAISIKADRPDDIAAQAWMMSIHDFSHVHFVSGSLKDTSGSFAHFANAAHIGLNGGGKEWWTACKNTHSSTQKRDVSKLVLCEDLEGIAPSLQESDIVLTGENQSLDYTNPAHVEFVAGAIRQHLLSGEVGRTLVLMSSYSALDKLRAELGNHERLMFPDGKPVALSDIAANPNAVVFGFRWNGVNYVENGQTLFDRVVIFKLPYMNGDKFTDNHERAIRQTIQGIFRASRSDSDEPEVWIMDSRVVRPIGDTSKASVMASAILRDIRVGEFQKFTEDFQIVDNPKKSGARVQSSGALLAKL